MNSEQENIDKLLRSAFNKAQRESLYSIWSTNARRLDSLKRSAAHALAVITAVLVLVAAAAAGGNVLGILNQNAHHKETLNSVKQAQKAQYAAAYRSCLFTNESNVEAKQQTLAVFQAPSREKIDNLIDILRPFRATGAPPALQLPNPIPKAWQEGCETYAAVQVSAPLPSDAKLPTGPQPSTGPPTR